MIRVLRKKNKGDKSKIIDRYCEMYRQLMEIQSNTQPQETQSASQGSSPSFVEMGHYLQKFAKVNVICYYMEIYNMFPIENYWCSRLSNITL